MRFYLAAGIAAVALAAPAAARDHHWYIGGDAGILFPNDNHFDLKATSGSNVFEIGHALDARYHTGLDLDLNGGYDFGMFRVEGEVGWKNASHKNLSFSPEFLAAVSGVTGRVQESSDFDLTTHSNVLSVMANGLLDVDFDSSQTFGAYAGGGIGIGWLNEFNSTKGSFAFQGIAGLRYAVTHDIDIGLKYRYFAMGNIDHHEALTVGTTPLDMVFHGKYHTNSVLASVTYNFGGPEAAPRARARRPPDAR